ncbi:membrane stabilizing protein MspA [Staphylococcus equorum]|uniref:Membrane stabilizing protein MspA n=1 Tax=Staphylococcus equorum TaxID=246432 RepID=A0A9X4LB45_9STAP|nr:membrane stabilizing protein MspA [Staphylococcus equorum]MDG0843612.1 membrane stabilizing protein MspA [Staphylococcus equorum]MDG0859833.1 membrane stabilizing protein MspA [Staphylococcus equorum]
MQLYLIFLPILYLIVSYISIFKMPTVITRILRIIMALLLLFVVAITTLSFPATNWWVFIVLLLIVGNVEITAFKNGKKDPKAIQILNIITVILFVVYAILVLVLY